MAVTERDIDILKILSSGPTESRLILDLMAKIYHHNMKPNVIHARLSALKKEDCVMSQKYNDRSNYGNPRAHRFIHTLYALDEGALEPLVKFGYTPDIIRLGLPTPVLVTRALW